MAACSDRSCRHPSSNFPQVGILGLHKNAGPTGRRQRKGRDPADDVRRAVVHHRVIDGQQAVLFLVRVKELMEDPASMLID